MRSTPRDGTSASRRWRVIYDDFLLMDLSSGTSIIDFADDALFVCAADNVGILELRIMIVCGRQSVG